MNLAGRPTPFWEHAYQNLNESTFGEPSPEIVRLADTLPRTSKVLDLGCGEGRNALFLAEYGFDVTAVDISECGISKLQSLASNHSLAVRTQIEDMRSYVFDVDFDLIISHGCLHLIERWEWQELLQRFKSHTLPGGYNVVAVFTDQFAAPPNLEKFCLGLFHEGELFAHYSDWEITLRKTYVINDEHPGGIRHTHPINKVVARKIRE